MEKCGVKVTIVCKEKMILICWLHFNSTVHQFEEDVVSHYAEFKLVHAGRRQEFYTF